MTGQQNGVLESGPPITVAVVPCLAFAVGHLAALYPDRSAIDWPSAAAFTILLFLYATFTKPGGVSGAGPFIVGVFAVGPLWWAWLILGTSLGGQWYGDTFGSFRVGLSSRGFGHAGEVFLVLWLAALFVMTGVALAARHLLDAIRHRRP